jgi:hypothetical protein
MHEAKGLIETSYGIHILGIKPYRAGYILETSGGRKYIKACQYQKERVEFIHQAKLHLINNNFLRIDPYCITQNNQPYIETDAERPQLLNMSDTNRACPAPVSTKTEPPGFKSFSIFFAISR